MKNFNIQSFTLMMMMMTVSSAAVPHNGTKGFTSKSLLKQIRDEASNLMNNMSSELKHTTVMFPTECWTEFFCLAEKSLNSTSLDVVKKLTGLVEGYNKANSSHIVNCTVVTTNRKLSKLVEQIERCSKMKVEA